MIDVYKEGEHIVIGVVGPGGGGSHERLTIDEAFEHCKQVVHTCTDISLDKLEAMIKAAS